MSKIISFLVLCGIIVAMAWYVFHDREFTNLEEPASPLANHETEVASSPVDVLSEHTHQAEPLNDIKSTSVFVPYWADLTQSDDSYDRYIYFGISVTEQGVNREDTGYQNLTDFTSFVPSDKTKLLTVRMLDRDLNSDILQNEDSWKKIATDVRELAQEGGFDGIVLDLELGLLAFGSYTEQVTPFTEVLSQEFRSSDLSFSFAMYGDLFFRNRPYNLEKLNPHVDEFMIMAYDFSKSFGNPGPNFPFKDVQNEYQYDFQQMIGDYLTYVEPEKISVIFGMYGYHWRVDKQDRALKQAEAITVNEINQEYLESCPVDECTRKQEDSSQESVITFYDEEGYKNIIWYEDQGSAEVKINFLKEQGIGNVVYWAYGYF